MRIGRWIAAGAMVAAIVGGLQLASVGHPAVAAPLLLLNVVVVARLFGAAPALLAAALGAAAYSYFFLPPEGFGLESPDDWIAFITFAVTAVIAGELASRAERRAAEAQAGRREIERLYQELQAAFERASEAEAARRNEALKAALLDALTHNLRTPLTAIKAAVTALIRSGVRREPELPIEGRLELLEVINEESDRLDRFVEGLSTSDSPDRSQPSKLGAVTPAAIVRAGLMRAEIVTRGHHLTIDVRDDLPRVCGRCRGDDRSDLHPARQRQQVRAGRHRRSPCVARSPTTIMCGSRSPTRVQVCPRSCASGCSSDFSVSRTASRLRRASRAPASACRLRDVSSRRRADASGSKARLTITARWSSSCCRSLRRSKPQIRSRWRLPPLHNREWSQSWR